MLKVASNFHRYSFNNHLMIFCQRPDATLVAGFHKWKSMNRFVKKGEKGLAIFAPCKYRTKIEDDDGNEKTSGPDFGSSAFASAVKVAARAARPTADGRQSIRGFRVVYVFDVSQTEGEELPDLDAVRPKLLDGDAPEGIWEVLVAQAKTAGFDVVRAQKRTENGYCDFLSHTIAVSPHIDGLQATKTLVHELGHALLHGDEVARTRQIQEVEVESVAYIVCDALGLDTSDYSFLCGSLVGWTQRAGQGYRRASHRLRQDHSRRAREWAEFASSRRGVRQSGE